MRITLGMISQQYKLSLNQSLSDLNTASSRSTTFRKFDSASEDPFSAAKAYRLRREFQENDNYQSNLSDVDSQLLTGQSSMMSINSIIQESDSGDCLQAINGTVSASDRKTIATKLRNMQAAVLSTANTKFSDKYIFGGANTQDVPFTLGESGNLLYRGIDVNTGKIADGTITNLNGTQINFGKDANSQFFNGYAITVNTDVTGISTGNSTAAIDSTDPANVKKTITVNLPAGATLGDLQTALRGTVKSSPSIPGDFTGISVAGDSTQTAVAGTSAKATDTVDLASLANEKHYIDVGLGLNFKSDGTVNEQSVFDSAIPGISFLGYGSSDGTKTGVSNNLYTLMGQIADQLESNDFSISKTQPYLDSFKKQESTLLAKITESGTKSNYLSTTKSTLESMSDSISEKDTSVEYLDSAEAIIDYKMQQYAYRAALQMGTNILQPTFLDFMK